MKPPVSCTCVCDPNCPNKHKIIPPDSREVSYFEKIIRYIPGPLVTAYMFLDGVIKTQTLDYQVPLYWVVFVAILILTPLYVCLKPTYIFFLNEPPSRKFHAIAASVSFTVWVFALGGPFEVTWPQIYQPFFGTILLVLTTLTIPVLEKLAVRVRFFQ
ncbi:hypothetical protein KF728_18560 [Candidatus Obscuribacterales bacterium]|nr:hypothetical protein [Candidatus Obscuribacterales bacterium]